MPKILIVDDDAQLRSTIQMVLKLKGYEVLDADNGAVALKLARAALPDLVISDINMPQADGFAALFDLRKASISFYAVESSRATTWAEGRIPVEVLGEIKSRLTESEPAATLHVTCGACSAFIQIDTPLNPGL